MARPDPWTATACRSALRVADLLDRPPVWIGRTAAWLLLPMVGLIVFDVISRRYLRHLDWVVDSGLHWIMNSSVIQDLEWHFSAALFFLGLGYACARNVQIRLDLFRDRMSPRARVAIEFLGALVLWLPFVAVVVVYAREYVALSYESAEQSWFYTGLGHRWVIKSVMLIGYATVLMATVSLLLRAAVWLAGPTALRPATRLDGVAGTRPPDADEDLHDV